MNRDRKYIDIKFYKLWKYVRITRLQKEKITRIVFPLFAVFLKNLATYQNWKEAKVFLSEKYIPIKPSGSLAPKPLKDIKLAIVIHVFYVGVFKKILKQINANYSLSYDLFLTCPAELLSNVEKVLSEYDQKAEILTVKNHGRDILPFLKILPTVLEDDYNLILKLHTKRSNHLNKKEMWSSDIFNKLIGEKHMSQNIDVFKSDFNIGMLGPEGHILPMSLYYGGNASRVRVLAERMGLLTSHLKGMNFVAGSMFFARREVLLPMQDLGLQESDFEIEDNQLDNTMAHAVERAFAAGVILTHLNLADSSTTVSKFGCNVILNHPFTL